MIIQWAIGNKHYIYIGQLSTSNNEKYNCIHSMDGNRMYEWKLYNTDDI